ncbi:MAG: zf-TFIIB domain-containing protein [Burkholderiaceae bacterium]|nr:zf-TFIIB domain-containing protein [Burkholderiaceae bacterium]
MQCPNCQATLLMSERQGIEIDYCPQCRGVWLDRGELDKLIERSNQEATSVPAATRPMPEDRPRHHDDDYRKRHRKKSVWGEIFDF